MSMIGQRKLLLAVTIVCIASFWPPKALCQNQTIKVTSTTGMIADIVGQVGGSVVSSAALMGEGVDPHLYKATRSDIGILSQSDVIFYNGLMLEGKMSDAFVRFASSGKKVFAVTELLDPSFLLEPEQFQGHFDPHVWMDPSAWAKSVELVNEKLSELYPQFKEVFKSNTERYLAKVTELDDYAKEVLGTIPPSARVLVTAHDAFNYFGRRYGLEVLGIQGISTESEAGVKDIQNIVDLLVTRQIPAVFSESTVSIKNINALVEGAAARDHKVTVGGKLFSDAMGAPNTYEGTYIGMIDHNVTTIAKSLGGTPPERGFQKLLSIDSTK